MYTYIKQKTGNDMNVTILWYCVQNAAKTKKAVDVIIVGAGGTIIKTTVQLK